MLDDTRSTYGAVMSYDAGQNVPVDAPLEVALERLPTEVTTGDYSLTVRHPAVPSDDRSHRFDAVWRTSTAEGPATVTVCALSTRTSQLDIAVGPPALRGRRRPRRWTASRRNAVALLFACELQRLIELRDAPPVVARPAGGARRRAVRIAAGVSAIALVAVVALVASLLSPPEPVSVDAATLRYRQAVATRASESARPAVRGRGRQQPDAATLEQPTGQRRAAGRAPATGRTVATRATQRPAETPRRGSAPQQATQSPKSAQSTQVVPPEGVYRYDTDGWEEVDVPGGHRRFPRETTQTVVHTRCGHTVRWDPMEERWDENDLCVRDGVPQPAAFRTYRSFFGRAVRQNFSCEPTRAPAGALWGARCESEDSTMTIVARDLGTKTMRVAGEDVEVRGLGVDATLKGANSGNRRAQLWHATVNGLMVHTEVSTDFEVDGPFGRVDYRERYTLHLLSGRAHR